MVIPSSLAFVQTASTGGTVALVADLALIVVAGAVLVLAVLAIVLFARMNRMVSRLTAMAQQSLGPVSDRARGISDNVEFITQSLRTDVAKLNGSVEALTERLHQASERMEERIEEFNALMEVVQDEAEEIFLDTASTVRGVREGARSIAAPSRRARRGGADGDRREPSSTEADPERTRHAEPAVAADRRSGAEDDGVAAGES
jgi:methyl-accepting chemotaxis protein